MEYPRGIVPRARRNFTDGYNRAALKMSKFSVDSWTDSRCVHLNIDLTSSTINGPSLLYLYPSNDLRETLPKP